MVDIGVSDSLDRKRLSLAFLGISELPSTVGQSQLDEVEVLDISNNKFSDYRFLERFPSLNTLILDCNEVKSHTKFPPMPNVHTLWVNKNGVSNLTTFVQTLADSFPKLRYFSMMNNPAAPSYFNGGTFQQFMDYRQFVMSQIPTLETLDDKKISPEERYEAERVYQHAISTNNRKKNKKKTKKRTKIPMKDSTDSWDSSS